MLPTGHLFPDLLGGAYDRLPPAVRAFHDASLPARFQGWAQVRAARYWPARLAARVAGLPRADAEVALTVDVSRSSDGEHWRRDFGGSIMCSTLTRGVDGVYERLGLLRFQFRLVAGDGGIEWQVVAVRLFGLPLPRRWFREVSAREFEQEGRYRFEVGAGLPLLGRIVDYSGWLDPVPVRPAADSGSEAVEY